MAFQTDKIVVYHIPKTGGMWVRRVLNENFKNFRRVKYYAGRHEYGLEWGHIPPQRVEKFNPYVKDLFSFAFVRHPLSWYRSMWAELTILKRSGKLTGELEVGKSDSPFVNAWDETYQEFIQNILDSYPEGMLTKVYQHYVGLDGKRLNFVGRQENLAKDLVKALYLANETFDEKSILYADKFHITANREEFKDSFLIKEELEKLLIQRENWIIETFYRSNDEVI